MFSNINKQKQIITLDKISNSTRSSFFQIPISPINSYIQSSFSDKTFSESCSIPSKSFCSKSKLDSPFDKEQARSLSSFYLRSYKKLYTRIRKREIRSSKRTLYIKRLFSSLMVFPLKDPAKGAYLSYPKMMRLLITDSPTLQHCPRLGQKARQKLKKMYTVFFDAFRNSFSLRPLVLCLSKTKIRYASLGLMHSAIAKKRRKYLKKKLNSISFRTIKFFKKKEKLNAFSSLKIKTFLNH